jgi:nucleotide-binding universal stress UspA family protein
MYDAILVPTDGSEGAAAAGEHAIDIARRYDATVHVLYAVDPRMSPVHEAMDHDELVALIEDTGGKPTTPVCDRAEQAGLEAVETIEIGVPYEVIERYVDDADVDLVVMGTHGRTGLERGLLGSVTERVVRTVDAPVLTVPLPDA